MPQLGEFDSARAAAAHTGLTPKRHQSGSSINSPTRISKIGNPRVRYALYMPAMAALRSSREFKELAARLTERGKKKMQIIAAAMHNLVRIAYGVLKNQQAYDPNYGSAAWQSTRYLSLPARNRDPALTHFRLCRRSLKFHVHHQRPNSFHELGARIGLAVAILGIKLHEIRMAFHLPVPHVTDQMCNRPLLCQIPHQRSVCLHLRVRQR